MAHFAKVVDGTVVKVIVAEPEFFDTFIDDSPGKWVQTSYNTRGGIHYQPNSYTPSDDQSKSLRKNYACIGYLYDGVGFCPPKPFSSWTLNQTTYLWEAPVAYPTDGEDYFWNEELQQWEAN